MSQSFVSQMGNVSRSLLACFLASLAAVVVAWLPELAEELFHIPGVLLETVLILALPALAFASVGMVARRVWRGHAVTGLIGVSVFASIVLHIFACSPLWQRTTRPGLVADSLLIDISYHAVLTVIGFAAWCIARRATGSRAPSLPARAGR